MTKKEQLQQQRFDETKRKMAEFSLTLQGKMDEMASLSREVVAFKDKKQIGEILRQYKFLENLKYKVDRMLLDFKIAQNMKSIAQVTGSFFENMTQMARELSRLTKDKQMFEAVKTFSQNHAASETEVLKAQNRLSSTQDMFAELSDYGASDDEDNIDSSIDETRLLELFNSHKDAAGIQKTQSAPKNKTTSIDSEIEAILQEVKNSLKG